MKDDKMKGMEIENTFSKPEKRKKMADGGTAVTNNATLDATSDQATNSKVCRGGGAALRGTKFAGVF